MTKNKKQKFIAEGNHIIGMRDFRDIVDFSVAHWWGINDSVEGKSEGYTGYLPLGDGLEAVVEIKDVVRDKRKNIIKFTPLVTIQKARSAK